MDDGNVPILDKDGYGWVLHVNGAAPVHFHSNQRVLACSVWDSATAAYRQGRTDCQHDIKMALGLP